MFTSNLLTIPILLSATMAFSAETTQTYETLIKVKQASDFFRFLDKENEKTMIIVSNKIPIFETSDGIWYKVIDFGASKFYENSYSSRIEMSKKGVVAIEKSIILKADVYDNLHSHIRRNFYVDPPMQSPTTNPFGVDPLKKDQWAIEKLNIEKIWTRNSTGQPQIIVADIDTGIDYNHEDLASSLWFNTKEIAKDNIDNDLNGYIDDTFGWDFVDNDALPFDSNVHGTHTAGVIAATHNNGLGVAGYAKGVKLMPLRFLGPEGGTVENAVKAIEYAVKNGAHIISASWGGDEYSQLLFDGIKFANEHNVTFVAAAGNQWTNVDAAGALKHYPASFLLPNIISVAATMSNDDLLEYSNWGPTSIHLAAPGFRIVSTITNNLYAALEGTSMATPHVAAAAALVKRAALKMTPLDIRDCLMNTVDQAPNIRYLVVSGGRLNIGRAVELAETIAHTLP